MKKRYVRTLYERELIVIENILQNDLKNLWLQYVDTKKRERLLYTLYHEMGHLRKSVELGFMFDYVRVGNRAFFLRNNQVYTVILRERSNPRNFGCTIVHQDKKSRLSLTSFQSVILAGARETPKFIEKENVSDDLKTRLEILYPTPYIPSNPLFRTKSKIVGTDAWLYKKLECNADLLPKLNKEYINIGEYLMTQDKEILKDLDIMQSEKNNLISIVKNLVSSEPIHKTLEKINCEQSWEVAY